MLEDTKTLLGLENEDSDKILGIMLKDAEQSILNYCHIKKLPPQLEHVARELVMSRFKEENGDNIASVKRGDTQITYTTSISGADFTDRQKNNMNAFRKMMVR